MTKPMAALAIVWSVFVAVQITGAHTILRCNDQLVQVGADKFEVSQKCGEPLSKEVVGEISVKRADKKKKVTVLIEKWVYDLRPGAFDVLTFEGGKLKAFEWRRK